MLQFCHRTIVPIQCTVGLCNVVGRLLGSQHTSHQSGIDCVWSLCLAIVAAAYVGQLDGFGGVVEALLASVGRQCVRKGVGTPGNAKSLQWLGGILLGTFSSWLAGSCVVLHLEVASHEEIL